MDWIFPVGHAAPRLRHRERPQGGAGVRQEYRSGGHRQRDGDQHGHYPPRRPFFL